MKLIDRVVIYEGQVSPQYSGTYTTGWKDPDIPVLVVEIMAGGVSGFGECVAANLLYPPGNAGNTGYDERQILREICQSLVGKDPRALGRLIHNTFRKSEMNNVVDAVDFALHDLVGRKVGLPVRTLLGGIGKPFVWAMPVVYTADPETMSAKAREWHRQYGFRFFKIKPTGNVEQDEEILRKVREKTCSDVRIFADPNYGLKMTPEQVVDYVNRLSKFGLGMCEDPIDADFSVYAEMRKHVKVPIMIDVRARSLADVLAIVKTGAADAINIHGNWAGGFGPGLQRAVLAGAAGIKVMIGSTHYLGIGSAAYQLLASLVPGELPCEQVYVEVYGGQGIVADPFEISGGKILIPDRPGLGVEVDRDKLASTCKILHVEG